MYVRAPDIRPQDGPLLWSQIPEFCIAYNSYSVVIPYVEYYLNNIMNQVRKKHCADNPELSEALATFVKQETNHSRYHVRFNQLMFAEGIDGLKELVNQLIADLKGFADQRSLAFNAGYWPASKASRPTMQSICLRDATSSSRAPVRVRTCCCGTSRKSSSTAPCVMTASMPFPATTSCASTRFSTCSGTWAAPSCALKNRC